MRKSIDYYFLALFFMGLILISGCSPRGEESDSSQKGEKQEELAVSHRATWNTFHTADLQAGANDLHIEFDVEGVTTADLGPFEEAETDGKVINLKKYLSFGEGPTAKVKFERNGDFRILKWWWTRNGTRLGDENDGPPP